MDVLALLVREPFAGVTPALYASLSDRQILDAYFAPRDDDGDLIPEWKRRRPARAGGGGPTGDPARAAQELPPAESLDIPAEAWKSARATDYTLMWWSVWRGRGTFTTAELLERWRRETGGTQP